MDGSELDRQQIRRAIRKLGNDYIFYFLDDAISLLSQGQLRQLLASYLNQEEFVARDSTQENLLAEIQEFKKSSLAGEYYEEPSIQVWALEENTRGTLCWIADFRRLLDRCAESSSMIAADARQAFEILFGLLDCLDDGTGEGIFFAAESGSWMVGADWKRVLPAYFRVLAETAEPSEYVRHVEAIITRHFDGEQAEMNALACRIIDSVQKSPARKG